LTQCVYAAFRAPAYHPSIERLPELELSVSGNVLIFKSIFFEQNNSFRRKGIDFPQFAEATIDPMLRKSNLFCC